MRRHESGLLLTELAVAAGIVALIVGAATTVTYRTLSDTRRTDDHLSAMLVAENAGYWICHDAQMADQLSVDNLTSPQLAIFKWTQWGYGEASVYHSATYTVENLSGNIGDLKRTHDDSGGTHEVALIAKYIYYNPSDPANSTNVTYQKPILNFKVVASFGQAQAVRTYQVYLHPNFMD